MIEMHVDLTLSILNDMRIYDLENGCMVLQINDDYRSYYNLDNMVSDILDYAKTKTIDSLHGDLLSEELDVKKYYNIVRPYGVLWGSGYTFTKFVKALISKIENDEFGICTFYD